MEVITYTLVIVYILSIYARYLARPAMVGGPVFERPEKNLSLIIFTILVTVAGLRTTVGDTYFYMHTYSITTFTWDNLLDNDDFGFVVLQILLQRISDDPQILVFVTAFITQLLIFLVLYKYSRMFELSIYLYITSGVYIVSMNGIRQYLAAAIFFVAIKYVFEGNWKKYTLAILLASTFHATALILIPIYFFVRLKSWTWMTYIFLFLSVLMVAGYGQFTSALFSLIGDTQYGVYQNSTEQGANVLRVVVFAAPIILAYLGRERLRELFPKVDIIVNMSLLALVFMIISTQNWIFARFSIYFGLYNLLLIPLVVKVFIKKEQQLIYYLILICYFIFYYIDSSNINYNALFMG